MDNKKNGELVLGASVSCFDLYNIKPQMEEVNDSVVDFLHFDVVDGHFNECIILGTPTLEAIRPHTTLPIDVHLAVLDPEKYIEQFVKAGADIVLIHPENNGRVAACFDLIRSLGAKPGLALKSESGFDEELVPFYRESVYVIKLTVNPGFSGQKIQPASFARLKELRDGFERHGIDTPLCVDGNVNLSTIPVLAKHGGRTLVGGTSGLFKKGESIRDNAKALRDLMLELRW
jgi:ribulose-phosphate 3-epimerase